MMNQQRRLACLKRQRDAFFKELERRQKLDAAKAEPSDESDAEIKVQD